MKKFYTNKLPKDLNGKVEGVRIENGQLIVEVEFEEKFEPKDGDFLISENECIFIYSDKQAVNKNTYSCYCGEYTGRWNINTEFSNNWCYKNGCRLATEEEKNAFLERLQKKCGKTWNAENKCLEDIRWIPKNGDAFYYVDVDGCIKNVIRNSFINFLEECPNCFKTEEAAKPYADQIKEIFKNSKAE